MKRLGPLAWQERRRTIGRVLLPLAIMFPFMVISTYYMSEWNVSMPRWFLPVWFVSVIGMTWVRVPEARRNNGWPGAAFLLALAAVSGMVAALGCWLGTE